MPGALCGPCGSLCYALDSERNSNVWLGQGFHGRILIIPQYEDELSVEMELWKTICPFKSAC
ncbi:hypothetical protein BDZ97DRAFT_1890568 [Flammula alnicola]|nr:hypothetical protein BDZ97DRAFT_1890568 [Flammula alnicola]